MVARRRGAAALAALLATGSVPASAAPAARPVATAAAAHPLHTSLTELTYDPAARTVRMLLRVFVDDFSSAVLHGRPARPDAPIVVPPDSAMFRYVRGRFALTDRGGRPMPLQWCGTRRNGDQLFVCLRAPAAVPPTGARLRNALLAELFSDQVNIVQARLAGRRETLLFTPGDGAKPLR